MSLPFHSTKLFPRQRFVYSFIQFSVSLQLYKMMAEEKNRCRHYTPVEKRCFLHIIDNYKHVIECKRSNVNSLRDKELAWTKICDEFNNSSLTVQERTVQQLKKLWTNMKHAHRDQLTIEKQSRLATGGGPELPSTEVDPEIAAIVPSLMTTAPTLFSSNMNAAEIEHGRQMVYEFIEENDGDNNDEGVIDLETSTSETKTEINKSKTKRKKCTESEEELKAMRMKSIMQHEERMAAMKEEHFKNIRALEIRAALAKAELAELLLQKEKARMPNCI